MKSKSLTSNIISNFIYKLVLTLAPTIIYVYVIRVIGVENLGISEYIHSYSSYFETLSLLSLPLLATSLLAKYSEEEDKYRIKTNLFFIQMVLTIASTLLFFGLASIIDLWSINANLTIIWGMYILTNILNMSWLFQANERFDILAWVTVIIKTVTIFFIYIFVKKQADFEKYYFIMMISQAVQMVIYYIIDDKKVTIKGIFKNVNLQDIKSIISKISILCIPVITARVIFAIDKNLIGLNWGNEALGRYSIAYKIIITFSTFIATLTYVFVPHITRKAEVFAKEQMQKYVQTTVEVMTLFTMPIVIGTCVLAPQLLKLFSGTDDAQTIYTIISMAPVILFYPLKCIYTYQIFIPYGKYTKYAVVSLIVVAFDIVLNLIFIRMFSIIGAAAVLSFVFLLELIISAAATKDITGKIHLFTPILRYLLPSISVIPIVFLIHSTLKNYIATISVSVILSMSVYFAILMLFKDKYFLRIVDIIKKMINRVFMIEGDNKK